MSDKKNWTRPKLPDVHLSSALKWGGVFMAIGSGIAAIGAMVTASALESYPVDVDLVNGGNLTVMIGSGIAAIGFPLLCVGLVINELRRQAYERFLKSDN